MSFVKEVRNLTQVWNTSARGERFTIHDIESACEGTPRELSPETYIKSDKCACVREATFARKNENVRQVYFFRLLDPFKDAAEATTAFCRWSYLLRLGERLEASKTWWAGDPLLELLTEETRSLAAFAATERNAAALRKHAKVRKSEPVWVMWRKRNWWPGVNDTEAGWFLDVLGWEGDFGVGTLEVNLANSFNNAQLDIIVLEGDPQEAARETALRLWVDGMTPQEAASTASLLES